VGLMFWCDVSTQQSMLLCTFATSLLNFLLCRFKTTDVAAVMDHVSPLNSSSSDFDTEDDRSSNGNLPTTRERSTSATRRSMRGLQIAISEGWLVQRARDMCSFAHDRYRQAAEAEALSLPDDFIAKMSFRVRIRIFPSRSSIVTELCFRSFRTCSSNPLQMSIKLLSALSGMLSSAI